MQLGRLCGLPSFFCDALFQQRFKQFRNEKS